MNNSTNITMNNSANLLSKEDLKNELNEFSNFAFKKNMIELSIAIILGTAFNKVVQGLSENLLMPIVNVTLSHTGKSWREFQWEPMTGMSMELGKLAGTMLDFFITAVILYIVYIKFVHNVWGRVTPEHKPNAITPVPIFVPTTLRLQ